MVRDWKRRSWKCCEVKMSDPVDVDPMLLECKEMLLRLKEIIEAEIDSISNQRRRSIDVVGRLDKMMRVDLGWPEPDTQVTASQNLPPRIWFCEMLRRVTALLGMSAAERALVSDVALACLEHNVQRCWDFMGVFCDWLADNNRPADMERLDILRPRTGDMIVLTHPAGGKDKAEKAALQMNKLFWDKFGIRVTWLCLPPNWQADISNTSTHALSQAGLMLVKEHERMMEEARREWDLLVAQAREETVS